MDVRVRFPSGLQSETFTLKLRITDVMKKYYSLEQLINMIDEPNRQSCLKIYQDHKEMFDKSLGSAHNHQSWEGGYIGHIKDILNIACFLYQEMDSRRKLDFSLSDALLVLYLHDLEKPWKYAGNEEQVAELESFDDYQDFQLAKIEEYGFELTDTHMNGIKYAHGEGDDHKKFERVSTPLAAFIHCCDTLSARVWFDQPKKKNEW